MGIRNREIGRSAEYNILYEILKKLDQLVRVTGNGNTTTTTTTKL